MEPVSCSGRHACCAGDRVCSDHHYRYRFVIRTGGKFFWLWIQSVTTGAKVGLLDLLGMWLRRVDLKTIVRSKIMAVQAGLGEDEITSQLLEAHYLAGGNVPQVIRALIAARKSKTITLSFREATAIDLAGRDVLEAVQTSVYPKVIDCPPRGSARQSLDAVAKRWYSTQSESARDCARQLAPIDRWCR